MSSVVKWMLVLISLLGAAGEGLEGPELEAARAVVESLGKRLEKVERIRADYEQRQTSLLLDEPLISRGRLHLRAEPGCLVLELSEPRAVVIRSDATSHQIYHPDLKRAERYLFESNETAKALLACFTGSVSRIEEAFVFVAIESTDATTTIDVRPRDERIRAFLARLRLTVRKSDAALVGVSYENRDGEEVSMRLSAIEFDPEVAPPDVFDRPLPKDVRVIVHRVETAKE